MRYPKFRRQHLFVGSGVIEAGCKTVIGSRLKQSGMFWTVRGTNFIIALRCCHLKAVSRTIGKGAAPRDFHFQVAHPFDSKIFALSPQVVYTRIIPPETLYCKFPWRGAATLSE